MTMRANPQMDVKGQEKLGRNVDKFNNAKMLFEKLNKESYMTMTALSRDKQQYLNPIAIKFMRVNMLFFRKCNSTFH